MIEDYAITLELTINSNKIDHSLHCRPDNMSLSDTYVDKVWLRLIDNRLRAELCVHQWFNEFIAYQLSSSLRKYGYSTREQIYILEETMEFGHGHIPDKIDEPYEPHLPEIFKIDWNFINEFYRYYHKYVIHIVREFLPKLKSALHGDDANKVIEETFDHNFIVRTPEDHIKLERWLKDLNH